MKKVLFLAALVVVLAACHDEVNDSSPYPPGEPWALDIVKFKNSEYKNYILTRRYVGKYEKDSITGEEYVNDSVKASRCFLTNFPSFIYNSYLVDLGNSENINTWMENFRQIVQREKWIELSAGYYLCYWPWQKLFCYPLGDDGEGYYAQYNWTNRKDNINNVFLMGNTWENVNIGMHYFKYSVYDSVPDVIDSLPRLNYLYVDTDSLQIIDTNPIEEHYVVTARSLYDFMGKKCSKTDDIFLGYTPTYPNDGITLALRHLYNSETFPPFREKNQDACEFYSNTYDSLCTQIGCILKEVIEMGKLQEYITYDFEYNKKRGNGWWGTYDYPNTNLYR